MSENTGDPINSANNNIDVGGPGQAFAHYTTMEEILDRLKVLNYDKEFVKDMKMKPLHRYYFAIQTNPGEQFFLFVSLAIWLIGKCGNAKELPQESDDPNSTISDILDYLRESNIPVEFSPNKLKQGFGENVIYVLDQLTDKAIRYSNVKWFRPEHIQEIEEEERKIEDEGELLLEKVEEEMAAVYSDDDDDDESILNIDDLKNIYNHRNFSEIQKPNDILESKTSNEVWQVELERVLPQLKVTIKTDARDWRYHLEQMGKYKSEIEENLATTKSQLGKLHDEVSSTMEKISTREKHLNVNLEPLLKQYREKQDELSALSEQYKTFNKRTIEKSKKLSEISEKLENAKKEIDEKGTSMTDGTPLINIKKAIAKLRSENKELDVRIGILENEILRRKFYDETRLHLQT